MIVQCNKILDVGRVKSPSHVLDIILVLFELHILNKQTNKQTRKTMNNSADNIDT